MRHTIYTAVPFALADVHYYSSLTIVFSYDECHQIFKYFDVLPRVSLIVLSLSCKHTIP